MGIMALFGGMQCIIPLEIVIADTPNMAAIFRKRKRSLASNLRKFMLNLRMFRTHGVQHQGTFIEFSSEGFIAEITNFADANYIQIRKYLTQYALGNEIIIM